MALFPVLPLADEGDEKTLLDMAEFILRASILARREGILALEGFLDTQFNLSLPDNSKTIIERLFEYLIDGIDEKCISDIAYYSINALDPASFSGNEKLALMMASEGVLAVGRGENPHVVCKIFVAMMGEKIGSKFYSIYPNLIDSIMEEEAKLCRQREQDIERQTKSRMKSQLECCNEKQKNSEEIQEPAMTLDELKAAVLRNVDYFIQTSADLRKRLREMLLEFAEENSLDKIKTLLEDYGTEEDTVKCFQAQFQKAINLRESLRKFLDIFGASRDEVSDLVCADVRFCTCIEELGHDMWKKFEDVLKANYLDEIVERIHRTAIFFEDVIYFDDISVQKLIQKNSEILVKAIAYTDEEIREKFLRNVSKNKRKEIEEILSSGKAIDRSDSIKCQNIFVKSIRQLCKTCDIFLEKFY